ncbi:unnamed protein product [Phyllotreta striolata]|uniref:Uncharacterized protein n=1 Tax=Phyllotreta striolata TaxID=444603 RepID=A0A9N9TRS0_PHYSR|nr:unnamed protein product [Phyllotreta striolata]
MSSIVRSVGTRRARHLNRSAGNEAPSPSNLYGRYLDVLLARRGMHPPNRYPNTPEFSGTLLGANPDSTAPARRADRAAATVPDGRPNRAVPAAGGRARSTVPLAGRIPTVSVPDPQRRVERPGKLSWRTPSPADGIDVLFGVRGTRGPGAVFSTHRILSNTFTSGGCWYWFLIRISAACCCCCLWKGLLCVRSTSAFRKSD